MSSAVPDSVISKITKLMALSRDKGATEAEASIAAGHVQRLLAEHNLDMVQIEMAGNAAKGGRREKAQFAYRQVYKWQRRLMAAIGQLHFCHVAEKFKMTERRYESDYGYRPRTSVFDGYDVIGRTDNVISTRLMFEYLTDTIDRLTRENYDAMQFFTRTGHSFKEGCADRLVERLKQERANIEREQERKAREQEAQQRHPGAAGSNLPAVRIADIVTMENDYNNDFRMGWEPGTTARRRAEQEERSREAARKQAERKAEGKSFGLNDEEADWYSWGYTVEQARAHARPRQDRPETEAQRRKRERASDAYWEREARRQYKERRRLDHSAYRAGSAAGDSVSLNRQVGAGANRIESK